MDGGKANKDHCQSSVFSFFSLFLFFFSSFSHSVFFLHHPSFSQPFIQSFRGVVRQAKWSCAVKIDVPYSSIDFAIVVLCVHINNDTQLSLYLVVSGRF